MKTYEELEEELIGTGQKSDEAILKLLNLGGFDGSHHKMYALDQVLRILAGSRYDEIIAIYEQPLSDNPDDCYEWDTGIAP